MASHHEPGGRGIFNDVMHFLSCPPRHIPSKQKNICITYVQCRPNVSDVGPTLYTCYKYVLCLLGRSYSLEFNIAIV